MRTLLIALALAAGALVGCGGDDDGDRTIAEAKQELVDSCHKGHEGDAADLKLCKCTGDRLEKNEGFDSAKKFDDAREEVEGGNIPKEVQSAVNACQAQQQ